MSFLGRLFLFVLGFLIIDRTIGLLLRPYYIYYPNQYHFYQSYDRIVQIKSDADILVIGSSHAHHGIHPAWLSDWCGCRAENISVDGADMMVMYFFTRAYLEHNTVPRVAVLETTLPDLKEGAGGHSLVLLERVGAYERLNYVLQSFDVQFLARWAVMSYRYRSAFGRLVRRNMPMVDAFQLPKDYIPLEGAVAQNNIAAVAEPLFISEKAVVPDRTQAFYLENILSLLRQKHIRTIVIQPPFLGRWTERLMHAPDFEKLLSNTAAAYQAVYYNLNTAGYATLQKPEYFYDGEHLNSEGASVYTAYVWGVMR